MANRAFLVLNDSENPTLDETNKNEKALLACNYSVPLFWFTMYSNNDLFFMDVEMDDDTVKKAPTFVVELPKGIERAEEREKNVFKIIPNSYTDLYQQWISFLKVIATHPNILTKYMHVDMTEIWIMSDDSEKFEKDLRISLSAADGTENSFWNVLIREFAGIEMRSGLFSKEKKITYPDTVDGIKSILAGYDWNRNFKWK